LRRIISFSNSWKRISLEAGRRRVLSTALACLGIAVGAIGSRLNTSPIYGVSASPWMLWTALALFIVAAAMSGRDFDAPEYGRLKWLTPLCATGFIAPWPYTLLCIPFAAGCLLLWVPNARARSAGVGLTGIATVGLAVAVVLEILLSTGSKLETPVLLTRFVAAAIGLFADVGVVGSRIYVASGGGTVACTASPDKFGFPLVAAAALAFCLLALLFRVRGRLVLGFLLFLGATSFLQCCWVLLSAAHQTKVTWWDGAGSIILLIASLCLVAAIPSSDKSVDEPKSRANSRWIAWQAFAVLLLAATVISWRSPIPLGTAGPGQVLYHTSNSKWSWSDEPLGETLYGRKTTYNYYCFFAELSNRYRVKRNDALPLSPEVLRGCSILVLQPPTSAYTSGEIEAILDFVRNGGGLFIIGDHTDAFGMRTYLNPIGRRLGFSFSDDAVNEVVYSRNVWAPSGIPHPVTAGMKPFLFYTGCSLEIGPDFQPSMVQEALHQDKPNYTVGTFFGDFKVEPDERVCSTVLSATRLYGKGRVFVWSDSTLFSNFSVYTPGKLELVKSVMSWLGSRQAPAVPWFIVPAVLLVVVALVRNSRAAWIGGALASLALLNVFGYWQTLHSRAALSGISRDIQFYEPGLLKRLPWYSPTEGADPSNYISSFISAQRAGLVPGATDSLTEALASQKVVLLRSDADLSDEDADRMLQSVRAGTHLLLLDIGGTSEGGPGAVLGRFGIQQKIIGPSKDTAIRLAGGDEPFLKRWKGGVCGWDATGTVLTGGTPVLLRADGQAVGVLKNEGKGWVMVCTTGKLFSDAGLGNQEEVPNDHQLLLLNLLFHLYKL
jgi:hypothetical protein